MSIHPSTHSIQILPLTTEENRGDAPRFNVGICDDELGEIIDAKTDLLWEHAEFYAHKWRSQFGMKIYVAS